MLRIRTRAEKWGGNDGLDQPRQPPARRWMQAMPAIVPHKRALLRLPLCLPIPVSLVAYPLPTNSDTAVVFYVHVIKTPYGVAATLACRLAGWPGAGWPAAVEVTPSALLPFDLVG